MPNPPPKERQEQQMATAFTCASDSWQGLRQLPAQMAELPKLRMFSARYVYIYVCDDLSVYFLSISVSSFTSTVRSPFNTSSVDGEAGHLTGVAHDPSWMGMVGVFLQTLKHFKAFPSMSSLSKQRNALNCLDNVELWAIPAHKMGWPRGILMASHAKIEGLDAPSRTLRLRSRSPVQSSQLLTSMLRRRRPA